MDTYRDDGGALHERVEALARELEETQRSLDEARSLASSHKRAAQKFECELMQVRPGSPRRAFALATAAFVGLVIGVLVESGVAKGRLAAQQRSADHELSACHDELAGCRSRLPR